VFWEWTAPADTEKPLIEMAFLGELPSLSAGHCAHHMQLEVLVIGEPSNILELDPIADAVVSALHHQTVTCPSGALFSPRYLRDSRIDMWIEAVQGNAIRLKFWVPMPFTT
jgi:hypothetical protein